VKEDIQSLTYTCLDRDMLGKEGQKILIHILSYQALVDIRDILFDSWGIQIVE
jgi:hypothetical protein